MSVKSGLESISVRIRRFDPTVNQAPRYEEYTVPYANQMRIMDVLEHLTEVKGVNIAYRSSCGIKKCGTCGVSVNGVPKLACFEAAEDGMTIEPLPNFPVLKDLVIDRREYEERVKTVLPYLIREDAESHFPEEIRHSQMSKRIVFDQCISCFLCVAACPVVGSNSDFLGPAAATRAVAFMEDFRDDGSARRLESVSGAFGLWRCHMIGECTEVCPVHAEPALAMQKMRRRSVARMVGGIVRRLGGRN